ncbi:MAG: glycosyltransferase [Thermosynechococcaceae cyanobacterium MS004]|nr:glycosyltransferase [Thermosynechococcaceae cyanobacterium MS004]
MAKIAIFIGAHLCTAPRPQKEALTLAQAGHSVTVYGIWFDPQLVERDRTLIQTLPYRFEPILDFRPLPSQRWQRLGVRLPARIARERFRRWGQFSPELLGYGARAMLRRALRENADLTIVHSEAGLWAGVELLKRGLRVGVDFEDWFSEDLLPSAQKTRPIAQLRQLEQTLAQRCTYALTTSETMAAAMAEAYHAPPPTVVYNAFPRAEGVAPLSHAPRCNPPSLHWFSHTIGPGRGLETLFAALPLVQSPVEIHLRGHYPDSSSSWMEPLIPEDWRSRLTLHPLVSNAELPLRIADHDIGLALETPFCRSRQHTITNKLFQYLQGGLAVIATDTEGQREALGQAPGAGTLIAPDDPAALAAAIDAYVGHPETLVIAQQAAYRAAQEHLCWEAQTGRLIETLEQAIAPSLHSQPSLGGILPTSASV